MVENRKSTTGNQLKQRRDVEDLLAAVEFRSCVKALVHLRGKKKSLNVRSISNKGGNKREP